MRKLGLRLLLICLLLVFFGYFQIFSKYVVSLSVCSLSRTCIKSGITCWLGAQWLSGRVLDSDRGPAARHINPSLVLVQPRKTCPYITERLLI